MAIIIKRGDIFDSYAPVIGHGVNIYGVMGAGIAKTVRHLYPSVYRVYRQACEEAALLGGQTLIVEAEEWDGDNPRYIANISSQEAPGADAKFELLHDGLKMTLDQMTTAGYTTLALPHIGAGIGGLTLEGVMEVIEKLSTEYSHIDIEVWTYAPSGD